MSNTFNRKLVDGEVALQLLQGLKDKIDVSKVNASRVEGVLDISNIPQSALPTLKVVQNDTERFKLTSRDVKKGDTVKVIETNKLYLVTNMDRLSSEEGYTEYAQTVNWDTIKGRPDTFAPSEHTQSTSTINSLQGYVKGDNTSALSTEDTLNVALGKLESIIGLKLNRNIPELKGSEKDVVESINKNVGQFIKGQVDNIDQITENGWYLCNSNCVGAPATFEGIVMNFNGGEGTSVKIWYSVTQESMYIKQTFPGVVKQEWTKVITKADVDNVKQELVQAMANKQNKRDETLLTNDKDITGAINELHGNKQDKNDGRLETSAKDIVEAINEVNKGKADKVHTHNDLYNTKEEILSALAKKEDTIVKNNAFNKSFGTTSGTVLEGDKYEDLLSTFESGQSRLEGVIQKKLDLSGGTIEGTLTVNGSLITKNNVGVQCKDNSGSPRTVVQVDTNNNIRLGDTTTPIIIDSDNVSLKGGNTLWTSGNFTPSEKQNVSDPTLQTSVKTVVGAINEVLTSTKEISSNLNNKAPLVHTHDDRYTPSATLDVRLSEIEENMLTKEPIIKDKKTAFNKDFGNSVGTVLEGKHLPVLESKISEKQDKNDASLQTFSKDIVGAINEIKANTLGSTGGKINGAINSIEHNGAGNYNIVASDERTVHGTLYGRIASSDGVGEVGLYNKKSGVGIRLKDNGTVLIDSKTLTTTSKEMTGAINELVSKKFDKSGGDLVGSGEILRVKNNDSKGSAYISFYNGGVKKGWIGRGSSGVESIAMHNQHSGKGLTLKHDGGTHIDAMNLNTNSKEIVGAINELLVTKLNSNGAKMQGTLELSPGTVSTPNIKFLSSDGSQHGSLNARSGDADEDIYLENSNGNTSLYLKDNGEVKLVSKKSMWISAPNLETKSKEIVGAINELNSNISTGYIQIGQDGSVTDLNTILTKGIYRSSSTNYKYSPIPSGMSNKSFYLLVDISGNPNTTKYCRQQIYFYDLGSYGAGYTRMKRDSSWSEWERVDGKFLVDTKLNKSGGSLTGKLTTNSKIESSSDIDFSLTTPGGWARALNMVVGGSRKSEIGFYGSGNTLNYTYVGGSYNNPSLKIEPNNIATFSGHIKTTVANASAIQAVRGDYTAMMGCSSTSGDFVFGGKPSANSDYQAYIRIANNKCRYHNTSGEYDILHKGIFDPASKVDSTFLTNKSLTNYNTTATQGVNFQYGTGGATGKPSGTDHAVMTMAWGSSWFYQMAGDWRTSDLYVRGSNNNASSPLPWRKVWTNGNFNPETKLNTSGGTISGNLKVKNDGDYKSMIIEYKGQHAMIGCSVTSGDYLFGGKSATSGDYETYIRLAKTKLIYNNGSANYNILTSKGGTLDGVLEVKSGSAGKGSLVLNSKADESKYIGIHKNNGATRKGYLGFGEANATTFTIRNDESGKSLYLKGNGVLEYTGDTILQGNVSIGTNAKTFRGYHNYGYMCGADSSNTQKYAMYGLNNVLNIGYDNQFPTVRFNANEVVAQSNISCNSITINGWKLTIS